MATRRRNPHAEQYELETYIESDRGLYDSQHKPIQKNLVLKKAKGIYNHAKAVKLFGYLADNGAKKYAKEFGGTWNQIFSVADRKAVAESLAKSFENEADLGNYDNYLPAKYQGWRLKSNPQEVRVRHNGRTFRAVARKRNGKVQIFVTPQTLKANPHLRKHTRRNPKWTMAAIKKANTQAGRMFFDKSHMKYSRIVPGVYSYDKNGENGATFVTMEMNERRLVRGFKVWHFNGLSAHVQHAGTYNTLQEAKDNARKLANS